MIFLAPKVKQASKALTTNKFKKLSLAVGLTCSLMSQQVLALTLSSEPNQESVHIFQPLDIKIEIIDKHNDVSIDDIFVNMASQRSFARLGLERNFFLSKLNVRLDETSDGVKFVHITSRELVKEPFLMFLLEVSWPSGHLFKDYTLLFDAPLTQKREERSSVKLIDNDSFKKITKKTGLEKFEPKVVVEDGGRYLVKDTDTLWEIAVKNKPQNDITVQQMMLSIQDKNPHAFVNNNINILKSGVLLNLPTAEEALRRAAHQANQEVYSQNNNLKVSVDIQGDKQALKSQPEIIDFNAKQTLAEAEAIISKPQLRLVTSDDGILDNQNVSGSQDAIIDSLENDLAIAMDQVEKEQRDNAEKISTISELEDENETLNRILDLKSQELAELQRQFELQSNNEEVAVDYIETDQNDLADVDDLIGFLEVDDNNDETIVIDTVNESINIESEITVIEENVPEIDKPETGNVVIQYIDTAKKWLMKNPINMAISAVTGLLLIILILALFTRNRRKESDGHVEDELGSIDDINVNEDLDDDLLSDIDLDSDDFGGFDEISTLEETDALEEAQKSIGYGDTDQAIIILEAGYQLNNNREDIIVKLLDLFGQTNQNDKFADLEARVSVGATNSLLAQIDALRQQYSATEISSDIGNYDLDTIDSLDINVDTNDKNDENPNAELDIDLEDLSIDIDDELSLDSIITEEIATDIEIKLDDDFEISLDDLTEEFDVQLDLKDNPDAIQLEQKELQNDATVVNDDKLVSEVEDQEFDFLLDELDSEIAELDAQFSTNENDTELNIDLASEPFNLDLNEDDAPTMTVQDLESESELSDEIDSEIDFMGDNDENSTKLNLAKAFVEMGDNDSAKEMLEEIIEEGDDKQKSEAQQMINSII
ncbi:MAG: hypothetical protein HRU38_16345 [Saccharospirillaceae bacterium]|nr:hypothetical protein [Pseudomonadales bacterium]NRB80213.1 hypothetical protein [Saccharospirillaceae bacterium]